MEIWATADIADSVNKMYEQGSHISLTPHPTTTLDHASCVWMCTCSMQHISEIFVSTLSPSVLAPPVCFDWTSPIKTSLTNIQIYGGKIFPPIPLYSWCIWHRGWITLQLNDKTLTTEGQRWRCHAIEFHQELLWELVCLDTSALVIVGRLRKKSLGDVIKKKL